MEKLKLVIARPNGAKAAEYQKLTGKVLTAINTAGLKKLKKEGLVSVAVRPEKETDSAKAAQARLEQRAKDRAGEMYSMLKLLIEEVGGNMKEDTLFEVGRLISRIER